MAEIEKSNSFIAMEHEVLKFWEDNNCYEKRKEKSYVCFIPENLTALKNGGRISPAIAAIGNVVGLKPVIMLSEGQLVKDSMTRHANKSFREHMNKALENFPVSEYDYLLISFGADEKMLKMVEENTDGFKLAEYDLINRGPGEFFGEKQSGSMNFKYASLKEDNALLELANSDSEEIISKIENFDNPEYKTLFDIAKANYQMKQTELD